MIGHQALDYLELPDILCFITQLVHRIPLSHIRDVLIMH